MLYGQDEYVGIDLHQSTCLIAEGKHLTEKIIETRAGALRDFFDDLTGSVHVAVEVGTQSGWLYDILKSKVSSIDSIVFVAVTFVVVHIESFEILYMVIWQL
jgi:hypothetical protein